MMPLAIEPVALSLGPLNVTWYGLILGLGAVLGLFLAVREGKRFQIAPEFFMDLLLIGVPAAIIGARTYYVAFEWDNYKGNLYEIIAIWHGGLAIHGALIGAIIAAVIYTRVKKVNFWRIADIAAPSLIAGQMIGRWGNFVNQEAHGGPVDRAFLSDRLHLPDWIVNQMQIGDTFYHPTFLYESIWNLAVLLILLWLRRRVWLRAGELFLGYFALYSVGRFFIEGLRTDSLAFHGPVWLEHLLAVLWSPMRLVFEAGALPPGGGNVRMAQFISLLLIVAAIALILWRRFGGYARERYADPVVFGAKPSSVDGQGGTSGGDGQSGNNRVNHHDEKRDDTDMRNKDDKTSKAERKGLFGIGRRFARDEGVDKAEEPGMNEPVQETLGKEEPVREAPVKEASNKPDKEETGTSGGTVTDPFGGFGQTGQTGQIGQTGQTGQADLYGQAGSTGGSLGQDREDRGTVQGNEPDANAANGLSRPRYEPGNPLL